MNRLAPLFALFALLALAVAGHAQELDFRIAAAPANSAAPVNHDVGDAGQLDFSIVVSPRPVLAPAECHEWQRRARGLDFAIVAGAAGAAGASRDPAAELPVIFVYSAADERQCAPCRKARLEYLAAKDLPFRLEWRKQHPAWVREKRLGVPVFHWRKLDGAETHFEGWPGLTEFVRIFEATQQPAPQPVPQPQPPATTANGSRTAPGS